MIRPAQFGPSPRPWWVDDDGCLAAGKGDEYRTLADLDETQLSDEDVALIVAAPDLLRDLKRLDTILRGMDPHGLYAQGAGTTVAETIAIAEGRA